VTIKYQVIKTATKQVVIDGNEVVSRESLAKFRLTLDAGESRVFYFQSESGMKIKFVTSGGSIRLVAQNV
jgi:hypothetical protein